MLCFNICHNLLPSFEMQVTNCTLHVAFKKDLLENVICLSVKNNSVSCQNIQSFIYSTLM